MGVDNVLDFEAVLVDLFEDFFCFALYFESGINDEAFQSLRTA